MREYIITLMARDRVGILSDVAAAAASLGGNITNASQTVMSDYFTLIFSVDAPDELSGERLKEAVAGAGAPGEFDVTVRDYVPRAKAEHPDSERFVMTAQGKDKAGIIADLSRALRDFNVNIEDFYSYIHKGNLLILAEITVPAGVDFGKLQKEIADRGGEFGFTVHLRHENIFNATGEINF
ncbi:MAG: ACT domain-containing protein [Abditibacteriota bacterium]|nr:ACT domain-containing protein [Abditibacteriota bacterium]